MQRGCGWSQRSRGHHGQGNAPRYQICGEFGHIAMHCFQRYLSTFGLQVHMASLAFLEESFGYSPTWLSHTGASNHATSNIAILFSIEEYHCFDFLWVGDGLGFPISHVGFTSMSVVSHPLLMPNVYDSLG